MPNSDPINSDGYIRALMDISRAITSDLFLEDLLKLIVMVTAKVMEVDICSLWLVEPNASPARLHLKATQAIDPEYVKDRSLSFNEGVVGYVASRARPLVIKNVLHSRRFKEKELARKLELVSMVGVPLQVRDGKVLGVLNCFTTRPFEFSRTHLNLLTAVANQAAMAILNAELMVKTRVIQEELETRKLVERAKEVLMQRLKIQGDAAYRWIQKRSMNSRKSIRDVAEAVLLSRDIYDQK